MKYIDTSALVKYYGNPAFEHGVDHVTALLERAKQRKEVLITSIFTLGEAVSVFDRWVRIKAITEEELSKILTTFFTDVEELNDNGGLIVEDIIVNDTTR